MCIIVENERGENMTYQELFYQFEEQYDKENNTSFLMFLKEFLQEYQLPSLEKFARVNQIDIQNGYRLFHCVIDYIYSYSPELISSFYEKYLKFNGNLNACIIDDMYVLGDTTNKKEKKFLCDSFSNNPHIETITYENKEFKMELTSGNKYSFYSIYDYFRGSLLMMYFIRKNRKKLKGDCHNVSVFVLKALDHSTLITELIPDYFVGTYYHSIVKDENGLFIDLANHIVYDERVRNELFQGEIVCETKQEDFKTKLEEAYAYFGESPYAEAILIAEHQQALELKKGR